MPNFYTKQQVTFEFFYVGAFVLIMGLGILIYSLVFGIIVITLGLFVLLSFRGFIIDKNNKRIKTYHNILFFKLGSWTSLSVYTHVVLDPNSNSQSIGRLSTTFRTNSYSVSLLDKQGKTVELQEFTNYHKALSYFELVSQESGLPKINKQEIIKEKAAARRRFRK